MINEIIKYSINIVLLEHVGKISYRSRGSKFPYVDFSFFFEFYHLMEATILERNDFLDISK
jgi:hypothetical protein